MPPETAANPESAQEAALAAAASSGGVLDPTRILQRGATSPYGAPGMPERVRPLDPDIPAERGCAMFVQFRDGRIDILAATGVERKDGVTRFLRHEREAVVLDRVSRIVNLVTNIEVIFEAVEPPAEKHGWQPTAQDVQELTRWLKEQSRRDGVDVNAGQLAIRMLRMGELLLAATGHVKSGDYLAWETDVRKLAQARGPDTDAAG